MLNNPEIYQAYYFSEIEQYSEDISTQHYQELTSVISLLEETESEPELTLTDVQEFVSIENHQILGPETTHMMIHTTPNNDYFFYNTSTIRDRDKNDTMLQPLVFSEQDTLEQPLGYTTLLSNSVLTEDSLPTTYIQIDSNATDIKQMVEQIANLLKQHASKGIVVLGASHFNIRINNNTFGAVNLKMKTHRSNIRINFSSESQEILSLLDDKKEEIIKILRKYNINCEKQSINIEKI